MAKENMITRARDELFSHINRCGVLQAEVEDQRHWMDETIDYLAERYPDLSDADLQELHAVGIRFCQPAIPHGRKQYGFAGKEPDPQPVADTDVQEAAAADVQEPIGELVSQEAGGENTSQES